MPSLPCSLWPIRQTRLAPSVRSDSDRTEASTGGPMAAPAPVWRTARVCPADPLALSHPQASLGQSQGCRGEVSEESWRLIGDGLTDWMTEELDFSSYLPNPPSPPSSAGASLPPSPRHNDIQVPSDLEVMTSLLQEELAQLEDYFLSEPLAERRLGKCERLPPPPPPGPQLFATPPYASHPPPAQPESNPLLVTLATGELDLLSICGGSVGRSKLPRHAAYSCGRPGPYARKRAAEGGRFDGVASAAKGSDSGNGAALLGYYGSAGDEQLAAKSFCLGNAADARRCEKNLGFSQDVMSGAKGGGFGFGGSPDAPQKKVEVVTYGVRDESGGELLSSINASAEVTKAAVSWKADAGDGGCYLTAAPQCDAFSSFLGNVGEQVKTESLRMAPPPPGLHCGYPEEPLPECFLRAREGLNLDGAGLRQACCTVKYEVELAPHQGGVRKQKKRDQNKTAAHRYRQRKRAELDSLEDQLHGLEGRNRELRDKAESVEREIQYVKDLLIEVYKARSQRLRQDATA